MSRINNNISSLNVQRFLNKNVNAQSRILEKLSSGLAVNRAADDAAGLSISQKMRAEIKALERSSKNVQDGISLAQTADGALEEVHNILTRMTVLSEHALDGILSGDDIKTLDDEFKQLQDQIDDIGNNTRFNGKKLFADSGSGNSQNLLDGMNIEVVFNFNQDSTGTVDIAYDQQTGSISMQGRAGTAIPQQCTNLAKKIAEEYLPNILNQIANKLPNLSSALRSELSKNSKTQKQLVLNITNIDGAGGVLASAQYAYFNSAGSEPINMQLNVDLSDFTDESIGVDDEELESALAHEIMHSVMQYVFTDEMSGRTNSANADKFDTWFVEGVAQLSGGGFPSNWNYELRNIAAGLSNGSDSSKDADIAAYLKKYSVTGRPYGHGYLAAAYIGHVVGNGDVAKGIDKLFNELYKNPTMSVAQYLSDNHSDIFGSSNSNSALTNKIDAMFRDPSNDLVTFVRSFAKQAGNGAGSIIADRLSDGGANIIKNNSTSHKEFYIDLDINDPLDVAPVEGGEGGGGGGENGPWRFGVNGTDAELTIDIGAMNTDILKIDKGSVNLTDHENAKNAFNALKESVTILSAQRSRIGSYHNRLDYAYNNVMNVVENLTAAESRIRDTDMAAMMSEYIKENILVQSASAMLSQANNQIPQSVMQLISYN